MKIPSKSYGVITCSHEGCEEKLVTDYGVSISPDHISSKWLSVGSVYAGRYYIFCPEHAMPIKMVLDTL